MTCWTVSGGSLDSYLANVNTEIISKNKDVWYSIYPSMLATFLSLVWDIFGLFYVLVVVRNEEFGFYFLLNILNECSESRT